MPKGGDPLSEMECMKIAEWINRGAKFDGDDPTKPLDKLAAAPAAVAATTKPKSTAKVVIRRPKGNETVAFSKDVAPMLVASCLRCHSGNDPKGGLSMETFEALWAGGKSGPVIEPGDLVKSRLWQLAGEQKPFKMPPGDARITRTQWNRLRTWIAEGAAFDGSDPKQRLQSLVPSEIERRKAELARTTPAELRETRRSRSDEQWRRTFPKTDPQRLENELFLIYGNVSAERLEQAARWAAEGLRQAQEFLGDNATPAFKGGLALFVLKDRASFEEFSQTIEKLEAAPAIHGAAMVTPDLKEAYVVVEDREDLPGEARGSCRNRLVEQLAAALLKRADKKIPDWLVFGSGRVLAAGGSQPALAAVRWPAALSAGRLAGKIRRSAQRRHLFVRRDRRRGRGADRLPDRKAREAAVCSIRETVGKRRLSAGRLSRRVPNGPANDLRRVSGACGAVRSPRRKLIPKTESSQGPDGRRDCDRWRRDWPVGRAGIGGAGGRRHRARTGRLWPRGELGGRGHPAARQPGCCRHTRGAAPRVEPRSLARLGRIARRRNRHRGRLLPLRRTRIAQRYGRRPG